MNNVNLIARLTKDPELSERGKTKVCDLRVAQNGIGEEKLFVDVAAFGDQAASCAKHLSKGRRVSISGRLRYSEWQAEDGSKRSRHSVIAQQVRFLDPRPTESSTEDEGSEPVGAES